MATIYDVARRAEVSPATVSRVVNGHANVDPVLVERVRRAMAELGYRPNAVARNLRRSRTTLWAAIISDIGDPFYTALVRGVEDAARPAGFSVVLCNTDDDEEKEGGYVDAALAEQMAGVIVAPAGPGAPHVRRLLDARVPVVVVDRQPPNLRVDTVLVDNELGAQSATAHLIESGYARIACITGPVTVSTATQRAAGYRAALHEHGRPVDDALIRHADFREQAGYDAMRALLALDERPDAVFAAGNRLTLGALRCLRDRGVSVPGEVGLVGFDDLSWAALIRPALTTVAQPTYELGRSAARLLAERIAEPSRPPSTVTLATHLEIRDSSVRFGRGVAG
ncbi:LacI family DNA-binding transcriptional regulator [Catenuloplanes indicus]|uniref:LacI family transcriptional regulator n=1 Tax=Catenuloplanes indicus TaxID=137267 RepID=A0AAE3W2U8_9ACTN|nr:LacI family DNA-binding transcriptional regulator [Catenuloplanes indicus]MDQ0368738.1 LacI family transcriptional regulator [Catenuloplanes indicus]